MSGERFTLDTNILVYSFDTLAGARHELAMEVVDRAVELDCWLTLQAVSEFFVVVTRKGIVPPAVAAAQVSDWLSLFSCAAASPSAVRTALAASTAGRASYWDALLVAAAAEAGCVAIVTEDLSDGHGLAGLRIHNPFTASGLSDPVRHLLGLTSDST